MDELTIGDKIYVSSKKAAKITGYAKDYVGQLCREGRVEARLVGRNWYVLESSLMEHRFGTESPEETDTEVEEIQEVETKSDEENVEEEPVVEKEEWVSPVYRREEPVLVPLVDKEPAIEKSKQVVSDMQTAWQEWFSSQKVAQERVTETPEVTAPAIPEEEVANEYSVHITHIDTPEAIPETFQPEEEVPITVRKEGVTATETLEIQGDVIDLSQQRTEIVKHKDTHFARVGVRAMQAVMVITAGIALCVALIGTGTLGTVVKLTDNTSGPQRALIQYLGGESTYKSISK